MFGLMKSCACPQTRNQKHHRRLHYCGACKTLGGLYGNKSRFFLNSDAVFLGEVLSAISGADVDLDRWNRAYQSFSCLSIPTDPTVMPLPLQYAATATVINAQFKIADHVMDSAGVSRHLPQWAFSRTFRLASARLRLWGFPTEELWECSRVQSEREKNAEALSLGLPADRMLAHFAESTGTAAGLVFSHGARVACGGIAEDALCSLGRSFGSMIYLLDALEDYEKDFRNHQFNALRAAYSLSGRTLPLHCRESVTRAIRGHAAEIEALFGQLPISEDRAELFAARLRMNLSNRLDGGRGRHAACGQVLRPVMSLRERLRAGVEVGKSLAGEHLEAGASLLRRLKGSLMFVPAAVAGFLLPNHTRSATSFRECMELASNLMLLGSAFRPALAVPLHSSAMSDLPGPELPAGSELPHRRGKHGAGSESGGDGSGWCDCCDCCGGCDSCCCSECSCCDCSCDC